VGIDLVRTGPDEFMVLEDNARTPSGVSYMLENRETMMAMFPELSPRCRCSRSRLSAQPGAAWPPRAARRARQRSPGAGGADAGHLQFGLLRTRLPGRPDGRRTGGSGRLRVVDGRVCMRTTRGWKAIDVLYRRVDDAFLDPLTYNPTSLLGVAGIMDVYRAGGITIANAPGTGIADDKAIYSFMPEIVEFYTGEKPMLKNVPTWRCSEPEALKCAGASAELVVKEVHGSGGYGMLIGPTSSKAEIAAFEKKLRARPDNYIAQPTLSLSTVPIFTRRGLARAMWTCAPSCWSARKASRSRRAADAWR
jgi:uncharacterized circularly permuted ATP-grasp superfamily protein